MTIQEFMKRTGITLPELAKRCKLTYWQMKYVLKGGTPKLSTAIKISLYSKKPEHKLGDGCIELEDLLSLEEKKEIEELKKCQSI